MTRARCLRFGAFLVALTSLVVAGQPGRAVAQGGELVTRGRQALDANKVDDAITLLEKALTTEPNNPFAMAWLGSAQVHKAGTVSAFDGPGWVKKGFTTLDEAVDKFPNVFIVYLSRAVTAVRVPDMFKKAPVAVKDLNTLLTMREKNAAAVPDDVMGVVYLNLGRAYKKTGQAAEARATWEKGKKLFPAVPESPAIDKELKDL